MSRKHQHTAATKKDAKAESEASADASKLVISGEYNTQLRFSPYAWAKIRWIRDYCRTEIAGFGVSRVDDPLYVIDFMTIEQQASTAHFAFDDIKVNEYLFDMVAKGYQPVECMRLWVHTHPGTQFAAPSGEDNYTFADSFEQVDWAVMIIVDEGDNVYARLKVKTASLHIEHNLEPVIDYAVPFRGVSEETIETWRKEANKNIVSKRPKPSKFGAGHAYGYGAYDDCLYNYSGTYTGAESEVVDPAPDIAVFDSMIASHDFIRAIRSVKGYPLVLTNSIWALYYSDVNIAAIGTPVDTVYSITPYAPLMGGVLEWQGDEPLYRSDLTGDVEWSIRCDDAEMQEYLADRLNTSALAEIDTALAHTEEFANGP